MVVMGSPVLRAVGGPESDLYKSSPKREVAERDFSNTLVRSGSNDPVIELGFNSAPKYFAPSLGRFETFDKLSRSERTNLLQSIANGGVPKSRVLAILTHLVKCKLSVKNLDRVLSLLENRNIQTAEIELALVERLKCNPTRRLATHLSKVGFCLSDGELSEPANEALRVIFPDRIRYRCALYRAILRNPPTVAPPTVIAAAWKDLADHSAHFIDAVKLLRHFAPKEQVDLINAHVKSVVVRAPRWAYRNCKLRGKVADELSAQFNFIPHPVSFAPDGAIACSDNLKLYPPKVIVPLVAAVLRSLMPEPESANLTDHFRACSQLKTVQGLVPLAELRKVVPGVIPDENIVAAGVALAALFGPCGESECYQSAASHLAVISALGGNPSPAVHDSFRQVWFYVFRDHSGFDQARKDLPRFIQPEKIYELVYKTAMGEQRVSDGDVHAGAFTMLAVMGLPLKPEDAFTLADRDWAKGERVAAASMLLSSEHPRIAELLAKKLLGYDADTQTSILKIAIERASPVVREQLIKCAEFWLFSAKSTLATTIRAFLDSCGERGR